MLDDVGLYTPNFGLFFDLVALGICLLVGSAFADWGSPFDRLHEEKCKYYGKG